MRRAGPWIALAGGAVLVAGVAASLGLPASDSIQLIGVSSATAAGAGLLGAAALVLLRRRSIGIQATVAGLTTALAVAAAAAVAARQMFISAHDLDALLVMLAAAGVIGVSISLWLGYRVTVTARSLEEATERMTGGEVLDVELGPASLEMESLAERLRETSARLAEARSRERALDASRRELVAWVSHDLRTPLAGIRAMAEALEDGVVEDEESVARYLRSMRREADRLAELVDDLFELSRIHSGTLGLEMARASLGDLVSDAVAAASGVARAKNVRVEGRVEGAPELELSTREMARVLRNLLENAIRHTPSDGTISIEAGVRAGHAYVAVQDRCGGIPEPDLERVFDVAFRGESARTPGETGGAGLGLAIARGIVEAHSGEIDVDNQADGCRFTVKLPLDREGTA